MANILIITNQIPFPLDHGGRLRIFHLSRQLAKEHACYLAAFNTNGKQLKSIEQEDIYKKIELLPCNHGKKYFRRHFRLDEIDFVRYSNPKYFWMIVNTLRLSIKKNKIDIIFACSPDLAGYCKPIKKIKKIIDDCDSISLRMERKHDEVYDNLSWVQKIRELIMLNRVRRLERDLGKQYNLVTTISPADLARLYELNIKHKKKITLLPNGVAPELIANDYGSDEIKNSIIFWGVLDFQPNHTAVTYFFKQVFLPYLNDKDIKWFIAGRNPSRDILEMGQLYKNITVMGHVDNLFQFAAKVPIMINPMIMGSGLKNKMLEAFALKRLVISNEMGIEGVVGAVPGIHYIHAESPDEIASSILYYLDTSNSLERIKTGEQARNLVMDRYTWNKVGTRFIKMVNLLL